MSDTEQSAPPIDIPQDSPSDVQPSAASAAPEVPPPSSDATAGVSAPGDASAPGADPQPAIDPASLSDVVDTPAAARELLGDESGVPANVTDEVRMDTAPTAIEHPYDTLQRIREKLAAYGAECLESVRPEIEYLQSLCDPRQHDHA
jgi:hypothetical protein